MYEINELQFDIENDILSIRDTENCEVLFLNIPEMKALIKYIMKIYMR